MKKEKYLFIILISLLFIVLLTIFIKNYITYQNISEASLNPFKELNILNNSLLLEDNTKTYNIQIDCTSLANPNNQIISYKLKPKYQDNLISVTNTITNKQEILNNDFAKATNIDTIISIKNPHYPYEQIFHIISTCQNTEK